MYSKETRNINYVKRSWEWYGQYQSKSRIFVNPEIDNRQNIDQSLGGCTFDNYKNVK